MVPIIGTFEAQEQGRVSGRSQPTHSITEVCVYNTGRWGGGGPGHNQMPWPVWGESYESATAHFGPPPGDFLRL